MRNNWIFQLSKPLSASQKEKLSNEIGDFLNRWKAHGTPVPGTFEIRYDHFILLKAEEGSTSGCSIDSMTREVGSLLKEAAVETAESNFIFYLDRQGRIACCDFREIEKRIAAGELDADTTVFDNTLAHSGDLHLWEVKLKDTWLSRYLSPTHS